MLFSHSIYKKSILSQCQQTWRNRTYRNLLVNESISYTNIQNIHFSQPEDEVNKSDAKSDEDDKLKKENIKSESGAHLYKSSNIAFDTLLHSKYV